MDDELHSPPKPSRTVQMTGPSALYTPQPVITNPLPRFSEPTSAKCLQHERSPHYAAMAPVIHFSPFKEQAKTEMDWSNTTDIESAMVDQAIQSVLSLPQVVSQVASQQKDQADELNRQETVLHQVQNQLRKGHEREEKLKQELASIKRNIYLAEDANAQKIQLCKNLQKEIEDFIRETEHQKSDIRNLEGKLEKELAQYSEYISKMKKHVDLTQQAEANGTIHVQLKAEQEHIAALNEQKMDMENKPDEAIKVKSGLHEQQLEKEIQDLQQQIDKVDQEIRNKKEEIQDQRDEQMQIKKDVKVLHKRNAAQLTRLKRQLKEAQSRNSHWNQQATQLERSIAELRKQLEQD